MSESGLPVFQTAHYSKDDVRIYLNSEDEFLNLIFDSVGKTLINRVDPDTGKILYLQGTNDEISIALSEMNSRVDKLTEYLKQIR